MEINLKDLKEPGFKVEYLKKEPTLEEIQLRVEKEIIEATDKHISFWDNIEQYIKLNGYALKTLSIDSTKQEEWDMVMEFEKSHCEKVIKTIYNITYGDLLDVILIYLPKGVIRWGDSKAL